MKTVKPIILALALGSFVAYAAETTTEASSDTSKNPITGTVTTTSKHKKKVKKGSGEEHESSQVETTKVKKDGTVEKKTETESTSAPAQE